MEVLAVGDKVAVEDDGDEEVEEDEVDDDEERGEEAIANYPVTTADCLIPVLSIVCISWVVDTTI